LEFAIGSFSNYKFSHVVLFKLNTIYFASDKNTKLHPINHTIILNNN